MLLFILMVVHMFLFVSICYIHIHISNLQVCISLDLTRFCRWGCKLDHLSGHETTQTRRFMETISLARLTVSKVALWSLLRLWRKRVISST